MADPPLPVTGSAPPWGGVMNTALTDLRNRANALVTTFAALPAASATNGRICVCLDTDTAYISDGAFWHLLYGDTGWRTITSWDSAGVVTGTALLAGWGPRSGNSGFVRLRRAGAVVGLWCYNIAAPGGNTTDTILTLPAGFQPHTELTELLAMRRTSAGVASPVAFSTANTTFVRSAGIAYAVDDYFQINAQWFTANTWPATLPGTAFSVIP